MLKVLGNGLGVVAEPTTNKEAFQLCNRLSKQAKWTYFVLDGSLCVHAKGKLADTMIGKNFNVQNMTWEG